MITPITLLDGGMSRELMRLNAPFRQPKWSALPLIETPHLAEQVHTEFCRQGWTLSRPTATPLCRFILAMSDLIRTHNCLPSVQGSLPKNAVSHMGRGKVAGSIPPLFGSYRPDLFEKNQVQRLATPLINGLKNHADIWLLETQSSIIEPTELIARLPHDRRIWLSFTPDDTATSTGTPCLRSGKSVQYATSAMLALDAPVDAILFNCSQPEVIDTALLITAQTLANTAKKFAFRAYANAFKPQDETGSANEQIDELRDDLHPLGYLAWATKWANMGASVIGGCCGIGVEHIRQIGQQLK
ncbi:homocysteine S-methyltransferase family protein [Moraxella bovoculi]|uniref:homocysteine S-methyltransferase family protein n=1 Tax=Moraxella bovoculi TaxID=386891 RepID=UPI003F4FCF32